LLDFPRDAAGKLRRSALMAERAQGDWPGIVAIK
jgi:hypothetical protein